MFRTTPARIRAPLHCGAISVFSPDGDQVMRKSWLILGLTLAVTACNGQTVVAQQGAGVSSDASASPKDAILRPGFEKCVAESEGTTPGMQECMETERIFHEGRINAAIQSLPDDGNREAIEASQTQWQSGLADDCGWDPKAEGEAKLVEADYCRMTRTAERASELEAQLEDSN